MHVIVEFGPQYTSHMNFNENPNFHNKDGLIDIKCKQKDIYNETQFYNLFKGNLYISRCSDSHYYSPSLAILMLFYHYVYILFYLFSNL